jgi:FAD/FMN-containing dehydrogenase
MEPKELRNRINGDVTTSTDSGYEKLRRGMIWNQVTPARYPRVIVQAAAEQDVVEAVRFAGAHGMKVAVRGGGHSWVGFSLRDESLLIDLGRLNQFSIDPEARLATVQPAALGNCFHRRTSSGPRDR